MLISAKLRYRSFTVLRERTSLSKRMQKKKSLSNLRKINMQMERFVILSFWPFPYHQHGKEKGRKKTS